MRQRLCLYITVMALTAATSAGSNVGDAGSPRATVNLGGVLPSYHDVLKIIGIWIGETDRTLAQPWQQACRPAASAGNSLNQTLNDLARQLAATENLLENIRQWDAGLEQHAGQGTVDRMLIAAEQAALERRHRRQLQLEAQKLLALTVQAMSVYQVSLQEDTARLQWLDQRLRQEALVPIEEAHPVTELPLEQSEYFQVKASADLRTISALPEVYGDSTLWKVLYQANKDKLISETAAVAVGTILIVPKVEAAREFQFR